MFTKVRSIVNSHGMNLRLDPWFAQPVNLAVVDVAIGGVLLLIVTFLLSVPCTREGIPHRLVRLFGPGRLHLWTSALPGNPVSRERWLLGIFGRKLISIGMRQLAVRGIGSNIAVVSFVQIETYQQSATPQTGDHFVVDIWINSGSGDNWRCTDEVRGLPLKK